MITHGLTTYDMHTEPATWHDVTVATWQAARLTAQAAFKAYCLRLCIKLYLYHRRSVQDTPGQTCLAAEHPGAGWELSEVAHIPRHFTKDGMTVWLYETIARLPVLIP